MTRSTRRDLPWFALAAAILVALLAALVFFRHDRDSRLFASKAGKVDLVTGMRAALSAASEAEKSALLATDDQDARGYVSRAHAATTEVEQKESELTTLLDQRGTRAEKDVLDRFSKAFGEFRQVDEKLLVLAGKNSNWKAYALAFGPAAQAREQMEAALSSVVAKTNGRADARADAGAIERLALRSENAALRIEALLAPHIAEESEEKMRRLEAEMTKQGEAVRAGLAELLGLADLGADPDLASAASSYSRFDEVRGQILELSRANTNVRSTALSLNEKRKAITLCYASLAELEQAILAEAPMGADYGRFGRPVVSR